MKKYKIFITVVFFFTIVISGVFMVNSRYTKDNGKIVDKSIFATVDFKDKAPQLSYSALYSEINISKKENNKIAIYLNSKPFDFRVSIGKHIIYINGIIFNNFSKNLNELVVN